MKGVRRQRRENYIPDSMRDSGIEWDTVEKQDRLDKFITSHFPKFFALCVIISVILILFTGANKFSSILYMICGGFVIGFTILGVFCSFFGGRKKVDIGLDFLVLIVVPVIISGLLYFGGKDFYPSLFLTSYFEFMHFNLQFFDLMLSIMLILLVTNLVAIAVISVIVGYFRSYLYRILRFIEKSKDTDSKKKRFTYKFFYIPDIIDVQSVELEPEADDTTFNKSLFVSVSIALFSLGMAICSYMFLNPVLLQTIPSEEMLVIAVFISMFISALVIPWSIMKSVGAYVNSQARPYYLWKGLKSRLYQGFFAVAFIIMIVLMSAYLGMDFSRIMYTYIGYAIFMLIISVFTSYIYVNHYYVGFKNGIISSFYKSKGGIDDENNK
jgi:hypothetical protein